MTSRVHPWELWQIPGWEFLGSFKERDEALAGARVLKSKKRPLEQLYIMKRTDSTLTGKTAAELIAEQEAKTKSLA